MTQLLTLIFIAVSTPQVETREFSCRAFPPDLSHAGLVERYGADRVVDAPVVGADDGPLDGTVIFPNDPASRIEIAWWDAEAKQFPVWVRAREEESLWITPHGISIGDHLTEIEQLNGWPFRLGGFSLEGGQGHIRSWGRGRLQSIEECDLRIQLWPEFADTADPQELWRQIMRGPEYSSGHPAIQWYDPPVIALWIRYRFGPP
jgi:hypothetical protein